MYQQEENDSEVGGIQTAERLVATPVSDDASTQPGKVEAEVSEEDFPKVLKLKLAPGKPAFQNQTSYIKMNKNLCVPDISPLMGPIRVKQKNVYRISYYFLRGCRY